MGQISVYGEFSSGLKKVTIYAIAQDVETYSFELHRPRCLLVESNNSRTVVRLTGMHISGDPEILYKRPNNYAIFSTQANLDKKYELQRHKFVSKILSSAEYILCKFCSNRMACLKDINCIEDINSVMSIDGIDGTCSYSYFCHPHEDVKDKKRSIICNAELPFKGIALTNGSEILLNPEIFEKNSIFISNDTRGIFCSRCRLMIGKSIPYRTAYMSVVWTNCVNVWTEELDIDGDHLRNIEVPILSDEIDFFEFLFDNLIKTEYYRIILQATTADGNFDYALLWLFDQRVALLNASWKVESPGGDSTSCIVEWGKLVSEMPSICCDKYDGDSFQIIPEFNWIQRVLYKIILTDKNKPDTDSEELLKQWRKDFSVTILTLPWETCLQLITSLDKIANMIAPMLSSDLMKGFTVGGIPIRSLSS